jgi:hypothetical protein
MVSSIHRGHPRPFKGQAKGYRVNQEVKMIVEQGYDVQMRIRKYGLTWRLKSARLITGTQNLKCIYRLEG